MFWHKSVEIEHELQVKKLETLTNSLEKCQNTIENLQLQINQLKSLYENWILEKDSYIKLLRDRIEKKIDYSNRKEKVEEIKDVAREKLYRRMLGANYGKKKETQNLSG